MKEPLDEYQIKSLIQNIISNGCVNWTKHAKKQMTERNLSSVDVVNVLRAGWVEAPEEINGSWRYKLQTNSMTVVFVLRDKNTATIVTAWRME